MRVYYLSIKIKGSFKGFLTTNAMEGGNWRLKYELRTAYSPQESISGRMNLMALKESLHTFKSGESSRSWAHKRFEFQLENVMSIELEKTSHIATSIRKKQPNNINIATVVN